MERYVHRDPLEDPWEFPGASTAYDGLGEITAADEAALGRILSSPDMLGPIRDDGTQTFARTRTLNTIVEERPLRTTPVCSASAVSISAFVAGDLEPLALTDRLTRRHELLLERLEPLDALTRCITVSPALDPAARWGAYLELLFDDRDAAAKAYQTYAPALVRASPDWVSKSIFLVSDHHALHQKGDSGPRLI